MILKNTYGLTTILSEKSAKKRTSVNRFAGSSLNRKRELNTVTLKQLYEESTEKEKELNFLSQTALLRIVGFRMPVRTEKDCFNIDPVSEYDWRYPSIIEDSLDAELFFDSLWGEGERMGYFESEPIEEENNPFEEEAILNSLGDSFTNYPTIQESEILERFSQEREINLDEESVIEEEIKEPESKKEKEIKLRSMSQRTKQKIRKKVIAFSQVYEKLTFLTLTFVNQVQDRQAVKLLAKFLDNCTKQMNDFQYIWVAERQTKNKTFADNIHFHLITNKYFKIDKYWEYWLKLQERADILPRDKDFKASSAFDIKRLNAKNIKGIGQYITKYVTKNKDEFECQVWNCSKKISLLYTDFYSDYKFIEDVEKVLECDLESIPAEYCTIYPIPLNRKTLPMYEKLNEKNRRVTLKHY